LDANLNALATEARYNCKFGFCVQPLGRSVGEEGSHHEAAVANLIPLQFYANRPITCVQEICRFSLESIDAGSADHTAMILAKLTKREDDNSWDFVVRSKIIDGMQCLGLIVSPLRDVLAGASIPSRYNPGYHRPVVLPTITCSVRLELGPVAGLLYLAACQSLPPSRTAPCFPSMQITFTHTHAHVYSQTIGFSCIGKTIEDLTPQLGGFL